MNGLAEWALGLIQWLILTTFKPTMSMLLRLRNRQTRARSSKAQVCCHHEDYLTDACWVFT